MKHILLSAALVACCAVATAQNSTYRVNKNLTIYNDVMRQLDLNYVDTLNYDMLTQTAIDAMLRKIDPYTVYMPEDQTADLRFMTTGSYGGIGAVIGIHNGRVCITDPYEGMPAQRNDVRAGDFILEVDGKSTKGLDVSGVRDLLRGNPHEVIKLKLERYGEKKPIVREFQREQIQINPVAYATCIAPKIGYLQLTEFTEGAAMELRKAVSHLQQTNQVEALVLDLRDNGGGLIDEAVRIVGYFVPKGTAVVSTRGREAANSRTYKTTTDPIFSTMRLTVLVNSSSASATEIVAGALQDLDRAVLIGERTFGKGLVQNIRPISYDGHLKITTAKYYIPSGRCIQAIDYSHRNNDGSVGRVPDSLTSVFYTHAGRPVRDGGGVSPDVQTTTDEHLGISYYLYTGNMFFDFATQYAATHSTIEAPERFELSDSTWQAFGQFLADKKFTYKTETEKYFKQLLEMAEYENLDSIAAPEIAALHAKLTPPVPEAMERDRKMVTDMLSSAIIKRYYYEKGETAYNVRHDANVKRAVDLLNNEKELKNLLTGKKK